MVRIEEVPAKAEAPNHRVSPPTAPPKRNVSPSDIRQLIPPLGLQEYWYPALEAKKVKNKPVGVKICGVEPQSSLLLLTYLTCRPSMGAFRGAARG